MSDELRVDCKYPKLVRAMPFVFFPYFWIIPPPPLANATGALSPYNAAD